MKTADEYLASTWTHEMLQFVNDDELRQAEVPDEVQVRAQVQVPVGRMVQDAMGTSVWVG